MCDSPVISLGVGPRNSKRTVAASCTKGASSPQKPLRLPQQIAQNIGRDLQERRIDFPQLGNCEIRLCPCYEISLPRMLRCTVGAEVAVFVQLRLISVFAAGVGPN